MMTPYWYPFSNIHGHPQLGLICQVLQHTGILSLSGDSTQNCKGRGQTHTQTDIATYRQKSHVKVKVIQIIKKLRGVMGGVGKL